jgi:hypothetical protein
VSLDKAIAHGQERRAPYRRSASFDRSCRHGGSCPYCKNNRLLPRRKLDELARLRAD